MSDPIATPPTLRFALMVDHFDQTATGKLILMGTFDSFLGARSPQHSDQIPVHAGKLVAQIEASLAFGTLHEVVVRCVNDDDAMVFEGPAMAVPFSPTGEGMPLKGTFVMGIGPITFPDFGHYQWRILIGGREIGCCPFAVWPRPGT